MTYITLTESSLGSINYLDNGGMEIWQRGTSFTNPSASAYTADRWQMNHNGTPVLTVTRESTITDVSPFSFKWNMTGVGGGTVFRMRQTVEESNQLAGKTVTFVARVRVDSGGGGYVFVDMNDTNGSTPFNAWNATTLSGASTWETIYVTRTLASNVTTLNVQFNFNNTPGVCYIDNVTLYISSTPVRYVPIDLQIDLARCQRFYEVGNSRSINHPLIRDGANNTVNLPVRYSVQKRINATVSLSLSQLVLWDRPTAGSSTSIDTANWPTLSAGENAVDGFTFVAVRNADQSTRDFCRLSYTWTASADY